MQRLTGYYKLRLDEAPLHNTTNTVQYICEPFLIQRETQKW